jgi:hypothetical protein
VQGDLPSTNDAVYFVGRSVGYDVLDERGAYDAATAHARQQVAEFMATRVSSRMSEVDDSNGVRYLPRPAAPGTPENLHQALTEKVCQFSDAVVGDLVTESQYWEQWDIREKPEKHLYPYKHRARRYKLWVLMSISREALDRHAAEAIIAFRNEEAVAAANAQLAAANAQIVETHAQLEDTNTQLATAMTHIATIGDELNQTAYDRETLADMIRNGKRFSVQGNGGCTSACGGLNGNCRSFHVTGRPAVRVFNGPVGCASDIAPSVSSNAVVLKYVAPTAAPIVPSAAPVEFCPANR